jgi:hypothetical protein
MPRTKSQYDMGVICGIENLFSASTCTRNRTSAKD